MVKKNLLGMVLVVLFFVGNSYAQDATDSGGEHRHHGPSQAAIDACSGKSEGDACNYTNLKGEDKSGSCTNTKDGQTLFCKGTRSS